MKDTQHEQVFCKNTQLDIQFINVYTMEITDHGTRDKVDTGKRGKGKTSGKRRGTKRESLFKNCFSLLGLLFVVH
jgi:hypothetical protein